MIYKVKRNYYKNILGDITPEAIFILGGESKNHTIKKRTLQGLITLLYKSSNPNLISGVEARVYAAIELHTYFPNADVVTMSHTTQLKGGRLKIQIPTLAEKMTTDLNKKGVPLEKIRQCNRSTSTLTELMEMIKLSNAEAWKTVVVISNQYHIERAQLLFNLLTNPTKQKYLFNSFDKEFTKVTDKELLQSEWQSFLVAQKIFQTNDTQVTFVAAEEILPEKYVFYEKVIDTVYTSTAYKNMEALEEKGIAMILKHTYNFDQRHTLESYLRYNEK